MSNTSDMELIEAMLNRAQVEYRIVDDTDAEAWVIQIEAPSKNVEGYSGFFTSWYFDKPNKALLKVEIWE